MRNALPLLDAFSQVKDIFRVILRVWRKRSCGRANVRGMSLEERVKVEEQDVTALHRYAQQTHAEREGWYREFRDARAESRGWAELAVQANNKVDGMDIRFDRIDTRLDGMDIRFDGMDARFDGIDETLNWHGEMLKVHGASLSAIEATLSEHGDMLRAHDRRFDQVDARFDQVDEMLREVLARLDAPRA